MARDEAGNWAAAFATPEAADAYAFVWDLVHGAYERDGQAMRGAARFLGRESQLMWRRGQIGMRFEYLGDELLSELNPQLVGVAPVPAGPSGRRASEVNAQALGVFSGGTPQQQLAVMRYLWFITGDQAAELRVRTLVDAGLGRFVNPDLLRRFGHERELERVPEGWREAFETALANGVPEPYGRNTQNIYRYLTRPISEVLEMDLAGLDPRERRALILPVLRAAADEFDVKMLGRLSDGEQRRRRWAAGVVMAAVLAAFAVGFASVWRYFTRVSRATLAPADWSRPGTRRRLALGYALLAPGLALTLLWTYVPLLGGAGIALTDYHLALDSAFVGVDNFAAALFDARFWAGLGRTLWFVTLALVLGFWPPILLAILLDEVPTAWLKYGFRTLYYLPAIVSGVIIMFLWKQLYDPSPFGVINRLLLSVNELGPAAATVVKLLIAALWCSLLALLVMLAVRLTELSRGARLAFLFAAAALVYGTFAPAVAEHGLVGLPAWLAGTLAGSFDLDPLGFISDPDTAMLFVVLPTVWAGAGPGCLLYLAALKTIPADLYEAAAIDGASVWQKAFYITIPRLHFLIVIQFMAAVVAAFKGGADFILAMTGGGPNGATTVLALEVLGRTFFELDFGVGAAMAWMLGAVLIGFTAYQLRMLARADFRAAA